MLKQDFFVHEQGLCESEQIGEGTRIWAFAHVLPGAQIGKDCNICDHVFIEGDVVIGDRVTVKCGVQLWDGTRLGNDVFIGPNATFTNDKFPRSKIYPKEFSGIVLEDGSSIGANATILPGIRVGAGAMVGAGAVVTKNVPSGAIVVGNPARITGYINEGCALENIEIVAEQEKLGSFRSLASGASIIRLPEIVDLRGKLSFAEVGQYLPFSPERYFLVYGVPTQEVRGEHAHKECHQFLVCVHGSITSITDDGKHKDQVVLNSPSMGLHIPPGTWGIQFKYSTDAVLLVLASKKYDETDYIRRYSEFKKLRDNSN